LSLFIRAFVNIISTINGTRIPILFVLLMDSKHRLRDEYPSNKVLSLRSPIDNAAVSHTGALRLLSSSLTAETIDACRKASVFLSTIALTLNIRPYWVSSCHCVEKCYVCDIVVNSENKARAVLYQINDEARSRTSIHFQSPGLL